MTLKECLIIAALLWVGIGVIIYIIKIIPLINHEIAKTPEYAHLKPIVSAAMLVVFALGWPVFGSMRFLAKNLKG